MIELSEMIRKTLFAGVGVSFFALACSGSSSGGSTGGGSGGGSGGGGGGGGGSQGTAGALATLEVAPATATVGLGGTVQYSVVGRDDSGLVIATPPVSWAAGVPGVGSLTPAGLATGIGLGQTPITAMAGSVLSPPAVLNVVDHPIACDGIAAVPRWEAQLAFIYLDSATTKDKVDVFVEHDAAVSATLTAVAGSVGSKVEWSGSLVPAPQLLKNLQGPVQLFEHSSDLVSDPTMVLDARGVGSPLPTPGSAGFTLTVDLSTCTFQFTSVPSVSVTLTTTEHAVHTLPGPDEGVTVTTMDLPLGMLQKGVTPLGAWRTAGMADQRPTNYFPSYSLAFAPTDADAYVPSGLLAQPAFFNPPSATPRGGAAQYGSADVLYSLLPQF